jgi:aspartyl-tRNA(Asn)/glutamyl-tRNA(Gln) amidotransferase subunit B
MFVEGEHRPRRNLSAPPACPLRDENAILSLCREVVSGNEKAVADYRAGKAKALTSLVGQVMKASKGKANPAIVNKLMVGFWNPIEIRRLNKRRAESFVPLSVYTVTL